MRLVRVLTAALSVALVAGATLLAAPSASADQIWYQGVGRASADAPCPTSSDADLKSGWSEWSPSWAQWANGGKGGYVCTRAITWAHESTGGGGGICVFVDTDGDTDIFVLLSWWSVREGTLVPVFLNAGCTDRAVDRDEPVSVEVPADVVWAPAGESQAQQRCEAAFGPYALAEHPNDFPPTIWACVVHV